MRDGRPTHDKQNAGGSRPNAAPAGYLAGLSVVGWGEGNYTHG